jgi:MFS transporter, MCT family, aspergillic acid transporter
VFIIVCYTTGILILALWIPAAGNVAIILFAVFFGFFSGAYVSLGPALVAQISPVKEIGFRTGLLFLISSFGGLTTGPIAGAILAHSNGDFLGMKVFAGVFCLAGSTVVLVARLHGTGLKLLAKF